jgi:hypothetical protein
MRKIRNFLITKTNKHFHEISEDSIERGFVYPAPHVYIYKYEEFNDKEQAKHVRGRPYVAPCALVRDSAISSNSIGIMLYCPSGNKIHPDVVLLAANIIRLISDELGIEQFGILTDEISPENRVDVFELNTAISKAISIFTKRL